MCCVPVTSVKSEILSYHNLFNAAFAITAIVFNGGTVRMLPQQLHHHKYCHRHHYYYHYRHHQHSHQVNTLSCLHEFNDVHVSTEYCQSEVVDGSICNHVSTDITSSCVNTTLQYQNYRCGAVISGISRTCHFNAYNNVNVSKPIQCCFCSYSDNILSQHPWWDCENQHVTAITSPLSLATLPGTT